MVLAGGHVGRIGVVQEDCVDGNDELPRDNRQNVTRIDPKWPKWEAR